MIQIEKQWDVRAGPGGAGAPPFLLGEPEAAWWGQGIFQLRGVAGI